MQEEEVEVEVLRSGRKRKVRRLMTSFMEGSDEDDKMTNEGASSDDEDFEPPPEEEVEKIEEHDDQLEDEEEVDSEDLEDEEDEDDLRYGDMDLPPKKRGRPKKLLTDEEIEEATRTAMNAKPAIEIIPVNKEGENGEAKEGEKADGDGEGGETEKKDKSGEDKEDGERAGEGDEEEKSDENAVIFKNYVNNINLYICLWKYNVVFPESIRYYCIAVGTPKCVVYPRD